MHCRDMLFTPRCSPGAAEFSRPGQLFYTTYGCGGTVRQLPNFRILAYFPHTNAKKVPSGDQPTAQGLHRRMITIFPCGSRRSKRVPSGSEVFLRLLVVVVVVVALEIFIHGAVKATVTNAPQSQLNKWVLSSFLNWPTVVSDCHSEAGRLF